MARKKVFDDLQLATEAAVFNGTITDFAKKKGCSDKTVYVAMQKYGIKKPRFKAKRKRRKPNLLNIEVDMRTDSQGLEYVLIKKKGRISLDDVRAMLLDSGCYGNALLKICLDSEDWQEEDSVSAYLVDDLPEEIGERFQ